ncbi:unnamed protein product [Mytilus coruscus]|uniref:HTH psq-type domain-containing protein n=1 Tax=Mytilus coruscus TaxID=42192 RepID=A0A6J8DZ82_MYTCO|nr:unnamed protein product [Mytilus coruscus]
MLRIKDRSTLRQYSPTKLQNAYQAVKDRGMAVHRASVVYSVPLTTLRDRVDGRIHIDTVKSVPVPLFNQEKEAKLVDHVKMMAAYGYGYSRSETIMMASDFAVYLQKRPKEKPLTNQWYYNFIGRWSEEIKLVKSRALEASRAKSATKEKVGSYFEELKNVLDKYDLSRKPHCIFNIDENGFNTEHKPSDVVGVGDEKSTIQSVTSGRSQTVTVIAGGNAIGTHIPPFFVFPGKRMLTELLSGGMPGTVGGVSDSGDHVANQEDENDNPLQDLNTFFTKRVSKVPTKKPSKPRKILSKITSGKAVTEDETFNKITECVQQRQLKEKSVKSSKKATKRKEKPTKKTKKPKKSKLEKEIDLSQIFCFLTPTTFSTSGIISGIHGPLIVEDSCELFTDSDDDGDNIPCCICKDTHPLYDIAFHLLLLTGLSVISVITGHIYATVHL